MSPRSRSRRRLVLVLLLAALIAGVAVLPWALGTRPLRPALERILAARIGFGVAVQDASLTWSGPQRLDGFAVASGAGFGDEPLFEAESVWFDASLPDLWTLSTPRAVRVEKPALIVIRAPGGTSNLDLWLQRHPPASIASWPDVEVHGGRARIEDKALEARLDADGIEFTASADRVALRARTAGAAGLGTIVVESSTAGDGTRSSHVEAHGFDLGELDPILRPWLPPKARCVGRCDFDFTARRRPDGSLEFEGAGSLREAAVPSSAVVALGVPWTLAPGELADPGLSFEGRMVLDPANRFAEFEHFAFRSSFFELTANGPFSGADGAPAELHAAVNFDLLDRRGSPLIGSVLPFRGGSGHVALDVTSTTPNTFRVVARGERAHFVLVGGTRFEWPSTLVETTVRIDPATGAFEWTDAKLETRGGTLTGGMRWRSPDDFDATLHWVGDWEPVETFIAQWEFGTFWDGGGEFDAMATWSRRGTRTTIGMEIASADLALQLSPRDGNFVLDDYFFRGMPFSAKIAAEFDPHASRSTWTGSLDLDAPGAIIRDDTFTELVIDARLADGVASIQRCEGRVHDGRFRAGGAITLRDDADAAMTLEFHGEDLALGGHVSEWAGQICPLFATKGGPYRVTGTPRLTGSLAVTGTGYGLRSLARNATGQGTMTWTAGTLRGSDLLDRVAFSTPQATPGTAEPAGIRIDGITSAVRLDAARVHAKSVVSLPKRPALVIDGSADWAGSYDFHVEASALVPPAIFERHRSQLENRRFALRGNSGRPQFDVPEIRRWLELDANGALAAELDALPPR